MGYCFCFAIPADLFGWTFGWLPAGDVEYRRGGVGGRGTQRIREDGRDREREGGRDRGRDRWREGDRETERLGGRVG